MGVVARERLIERVGQYVARDPDATLTTVLGCFQLDPAEESEERALIKDVLDRHGESTPARDGVDAEPGNVKAWATPTRASGAQHSAVKISRSRVTTAASASTPRRSSSAIPTLRARS